MIVNLKKSFILESLSITYPFNDGDDSQFRDEQKSGTIFVNKRRLQWIKENSK